MLPLPQPEGLELPQTPEIRYPDLVSSAHMPLCLLWCCLACHLAVCGPVPWEPGSTAVPAAPQLYMVGEQRARAHPGLRPAWADPSPPGETPFSPRLHQVPTAAATACARSKHVAFKWPPAFPLTAPPRPVPGCSGSSRQPSRLSVTQTQVVSAADPSAGQQPQDHEDFWGAQPLTLRLCPPGPSSMVIRDLTLRSAASFGSFHLIRLLYDEYMFYLVEHRVAEATGETPIAVMGEVSPGARQAGGHGVLRRPGAGRAQGLALVPAAGALPAVAPDTPGSGDTGAGHTQQTWPVMFWSWGLNQQCSPTARPSPSCFETGSLSLSHLGWPTTVTPPQLPNQLGWPCGHRRATWSAPCRASGHLQCVPRPQSTLPQTALSP